MVPALTRLISLVSLNMSYNQLTQLTNSSELPTKIQILDFHANYITFVAKTYFARFTSLTSVNLAQNGLRTLREIHFASLKIKHLFLASTNLEIVEIFFSAPNGTKSKIKLDRIDLSRNNLNQVPLVTGYVRSAQLVDLSEQKTNKFLNEQSFNTLAIRLPTFIGHLNLRNNQLTSIKGGLNRRFFNSIDLSWNFLGMGSLCELFGHDVFINDSSSSGGGSSSNLLMRSVEVTFFPQKRPNRNTLVTCADLIAKNKRGVGGFKSADLVSTGGGGGLMEVRNRTKLVILKNCDFRLEKNSRINGTNSTGNMCNNT
jgi:Leucine-rich repeat (LRR) protein